MNTQNKPKWANSEHYEKIHAHLADNNLNTENSYYYVEILEQKGFTVYHKDLKEWLASRGTALLAKDLEL